MWLPIASVQSHHTERANQSHGHSLRFSRLAIKKAGGGARVYVEPGFRYRQRKQSL